MKILYIEDNMTMAKHVQRVLKRHHKILFAANCAEVPGLLDQQPDLILMDLGLPDCDGITFLRQIREKMPTIPIIATTAYAMNDEREQCFAAGCTDYLSKPYEITELLELIDGYADATSVQGLKS